MADVKTLSNLMMVMEHTLAEGMCVIRGKPHDAAQLSLRCQMSKKNISPFFFQPSVFFSLVSPLLNPKLHIISLIPVHILFPFNFPLLFRIRQLKLKQSRPKSLET